MSSTKLRIALVTNFHLACMLLLDLQKILKMLRFLSKLVVYCIKNSNILPVAVGGPRSTNCQNNLKCLIFVKSPNFIQ